MPPTNILLTGAPGFIGYHCVLDLLNHGYQVRGSVGDLSRPEAVEVNLSANEAHTSKLDWVQASLTEPNNWSAAVD